jgi:DNA-3-methyladenine glycosylase II
LEAAGYSTPEAILGATDEELRGCGLSRQKIKYLNALAGAGIDFDALRAAPDDEVYETLVAVLGIGKWTAEMYLIFALGRADVFAPDDMALQEGARLLFGLTERPKPRPFREMAQAWGPWRSVAARALWSYYGAMKNRQGETL